jgi:hypothetical protein
MKHLLFLLITLVTIGLSNASAQSNKDVLTNANVVAMVKGNLPQSIIISTIQNSGTQFNMSPKAMIALKKQGVSDDVLTAMSAKGEVTDTPAPAVAANTGPQKAGKPLKGETGLGKFDPGIYYNDEAAGKPTELEASVFSQAKVGSGFLSAVTYGAAKTKAKAILSGTEASFHITNANPVFYFIFPHNTNGGIGNEGSSNGWYSNATSPNEFLLVKFKVAKKGREIITGTFGTYSGFSGGIADENKVLYRFTKISPGVYKVYFETPLTVGEYAFIFAGASANMMGGTTSQKAFDFSVKQ